LLSITACDSLPLPPLQATKNPQSVPSGASEPALEKERLCQAFDFVAAKDVDGAYAVAMRNFGFRTFDERKRAVVNPGYPLAGDTYVHTAQPGAFYRLSDWVSLPSSTDRATWMRLELSKLSATQTGIKGYACAKAGGPDNRAAQVESLKAAL
jgi:hypothetical protein